VADQKDIRLPALLQKLNERAERVLDDVEFLSEIPSDCPDEVVSLSIKRHLMMFFKEAVHNCARHAQATKVCLTVSVMERQLRIVLRDNGGGFDESQPVDGWGLGSMKQRAREMGGEMEMWSAPGEGTEITLRLPFSSLSREPSNPYKTSN
ncbi:MAG: sensor histidine kinase, partial [Verrucomicrobiales bacterium]